MREWLKRFAGDTSAVTSIEYGLLTALVASVMIAGLNELGSNLNAQMIAIGTSP